MKEVSLRFPAGHFYSPIVDPTQISEYLNTVGRKTHDELIPEILIECERMTIFWQNHVERFARKPFQRYASPDCRYYSQNSSYGYGDALILRTIINAFRPDRIIEIGSGFSTACILDAADEASLEHLNLTCIDPFTHRLQQLLRDNDKSRLTIIEKCVQAVPIDVFRMLQDGDILFIDSTHVLKTGSDVHYELFHILPALKSGVYIHFHDIQFPFEYPNSWIYEENFSWNEIYALQAFLMYNNSFRIEFFTNLFGRKFHHLVQEQFPELSQYPESLGGSLWIRKL